jgi:outer membrane protein assembly factor BamA
VAARDGESAWETALRAPFRVVFFPLRLLARGVEAGAGYIGPRYLEPKAQEPPKRGLSFGPSIIVGGPSDFGIGPSITWSGLPTADSKLLLAGSWSLSDRRRVRFLESIGARRPLGLRLGVHYDYRPDRAYYGIGNDASLSDRAYYRLETTNADAALLVGASPLRQVRFIGGYSAMSPRRGYNAAPLLEDAFAASSVPFEHQTTQELWYGIAGDLAVLDDDRDPSLGVHGRADLRRATGMKPGDPDYTQWRVEGRAYVPVFASRRVIAVRGVYEGIEPSGSETTDLPYYRLPKSGGTSTFAGYANDQFRDRRLLLARVEYRWAILKRMSAIAMYELGEVAPNAASFRLREAHASYGGGLRLGMADDSSLRFELAKSVEGMRVALTLGSDF